MSKKLNFLEILLLLYLCVGMLKGIKIFEYADYIISLVMQIICILKLKKSKTESNRKIITLYVILIFQILFIGFNFLLINVSIGKIVKRLLPLLSVFGIIIVANDDSIKLDSIITKTIKFYFWLGIVLIINSVIYYIFKTSLWKPDIYLGYRFSGPFYDSNFLSITYSVILIMFYYTRDKLLKKNIFYMLVFVLCILIGKSWSAVILLILSIVLGNLIKEKSIMRKQLIFILIYFVFLFFANKYSAQIKESFYNIMEKITSYDYAQIGAKYNSFNYRIVAQTDAIRLFLQRILGYGPLQMVNYLGMDVHNSYVSFLFEMGIVGFLLQIFCLFEIPIVKNKFLNIISNFILLISFTINIHYSIIFALLLLLLHSSKFNKEETTLELKKE